MKTIIQNILFSQGSDEYGKEDLYFRIQNGAFLRDKNCILLYNNGQLLLNTYFNIFSADKWKNYTNLENICFKFKFEGIINIKFIKHIANTDVEIFEEMVNSEVDSLFEKQFYLNELNGIVYIKIESVSEKSKIYEGTIETDSFPQNVVINAVMCTYKREEYVKHNYEILKNRLIDSEIGTHFKITIVDNGQSLVASDFKGVKILPNINCGGSGGFARGLIDAMSDSEITHVCFMDDDIVLSIESFYRVLSFYSYAKNELCIAGTMLRIEDPCIVYESGARYEVPNKCITSFHNADLKNKDIVFCIDTDRYIGYGGWWFYVFPVNKSQNMPFPFFLYRDDIVFDYTNKHNIITLNGVSVWHESFDGKMIPFKMYFNDRNGNVADILLGNSNGLKISLDFFKRICGLLFTYQYAMAETSLNAYNDFCYNYYDYYDINYKNLLERAFSVKDLKTVVEGRYKKIAMESVAFNEKLGFPCRKFLRILSLNGHLLPDIFLIDKSISYTKTFIAVHENSIKAWKVFRRKKIYCISRDNNVYLSCMNKSKFFKILYKSICLSVVLMFRYNKLKKIYRKIYKELTVKQYWTHLFSSNARKYL